MTTIVGVRRPAGPGRGGVENSEREEREQIGRETTSPNEPTHEATTPPGNPDRDEDAVKEAEEGLEQSGGGH